MNGFCIKESRTQVSRPPIEATVLGCCVVIGDACENSLTVAADRVNLTSNTSDYQVRLRTCIWSSPPPLIPDAEEPPLSAVRPTTSGLLWGKVCPADENSLQFLRTFPPLSRKSWQLRTLLAWSSEATARAPQFSLARLFGAPVLRRRSEAVRLLAPDDLLH